MKREGDSDRIFQSALSNLTSLFAESKAASDLATEFELYYDNWTVKQ